MNRKQEKPNEETVARWVSELPRVEADPAFRDALRARFASGEFAAAQTEPERHAETEHAPSTRASRRPWWSWVTPAAAAAALVLAIVILNRGPALRVVETTGAGVVSINDRDVPLDDMAALNAGMKAGARIEVPASATVDLMINNVAMVELAGGTEMTLPASPGRWFGRAVEANLLAGEIRLKTGVDFAGKALRVTTPEGVVEVTGTLLSIQCDATGTCVCVVEGVAHAGIGEGDMEPVRSGFRKIMLRDGTVGIVPIEATHRDGVVDFDQRVGGTM